MPDDMKAVVERLETALANARARLEVLSAVGVVPGSKVVSEWAAEAAAALTGSREHG